MSDKKPRIIYAALARVSSEKAERQGESLTSQKAFIAGCVKALGGNPDKDILWDFCGQEHTVTDMASKERKLLKALMAEAGSERRRFQAVMVQYLDRIGRNRRFFEDFVDLLYTHDITLYVGTQPYDPDNTAEEFSVHSQKEAFHYHARITLEKSFDNKVRRAQRGIYVQGKLYGRTRDEKDPTVWHVDPVIRKKLERAAVALDRGESPRKVGKRIGMDWRWLYKVLRHRAGSRIECSLGTEAFKKWSPSKGNAFKYTVTVPPLVRDEALLKRVVARLDSNAAKFNNRAPQDIRTPGRCDFALQGLVRCGHCGYTMTPQRIKFKHVPEAELKRKRKRLRNAEGVNYYYRHAMWDGCYLDYRDKYPKGKSDKPFPLTVSSSRLEHAALAALFEEMDTNKALINAIRESERKNGKEQKALERKLTDLRARQKDLQSQKRRLIAVIKGGLQSDRDFIGEANSLNDQLANIEVDIKAGERQLTLIESPETIKQRAERVFKSLRHQQVSEAIEEQIEKERKRRWQSLTAEDPETGNILSAQERAKKRVLMLTNAQRRAIVLPLFEGPGSGVFVFKRKDGLQGEIRATGYPHIEFRI